MCKSSPALSLAVACGASIYAKYLFGLPLADFKVRVYSTLKWNYLKHRLSACYRTPVIKRQNGWKKQKKNIPTISVYDTTWKIQSRQHARERCTDTAACATDMTCSCGTTCNSAENTDHTHTVSTLDYKRLTTHRCLELHKISKSVSCSTGRGKVRMQTVNANKKPVKWG